jgi:alpha-mannosidase
MRRWGWAVILSVVTASVGRAQTRPPSAGPVLYYIPHTHWEGAVFKTREEYLDMGLPNILTALSLLKVHPEFKFTLDQAAYVKPFLERYPEESGAFRKFVTQGRIEIVGGMDVMPDVVKPGGELFVRQIQYGKRTFHDLLGIDVKAAWLVDTFGHHPQMPQLLRQAGFDSFWFCRGVPTDNMPSEFLWRGIDGTEIPAFWLPGFYGLFYGPPRDTAGFALFFRDRFNSLAPHNTNLERVGLAGVDVSEPEEYVPPMVAAYNREQGRPLTIRYSTPSEFAAVANQRPNRPVISADFNPIFQGTYSSRIELKQRTRLIEQKLLTAEKLGSISAAIGDTVDRTQIWKAWEPLLFNQTHDLASGVMTDHVYEDVQRGYDLSERLADDMISDRWNRTSARIDTRGPGIPVVVFNPLGWQRNDIAEVEVGFASGGVRAVEVIDSAGNVTPSQLIRADRYPDGAMKRLTVAFLARNIPSVGWSVYHIRPTTTITPPPTGFSANVMENEFYRVTVDRTSGAITSIVDKSANWEALSGSANVIARQQDRGDLWELYKGLDGASHIAMTDKQPVPDAKTAKLSTALAGKPGTIVTGPLFTEFTVAHPLDTGTFSTRVRLYRGIKRVDIETTLVNHEKFVRYQALFPTSIINGRNVQEIPFGSVERPVGIEFPAQQWADWGDGRHGVALLNTGMPGNLVSDGTLMLSLLRSHNLGGYGYGGGYEPGMACETGFELDKPLTFRYSLVPHVADWKQAKVFRAALEVNQPLLARKVAAHGGALPSRWGLLSVSDPNVVLTSVNPGPNGRTIVRVYEAAGSSAANVAARVAVPTSSANESDLMERSGKRLTVRNNTVGFNLHPFEIKTISLMLGVAAKPSPTLPARRTVQ